MYQSLCANCQSPGNSACKSCLLVHYCGRECQRVHWKEHKLWCKSPLIKDSWQPQWVKDNRKPAFVGEQSIGVTFGAKKKYLWGNVPAIDVLCLSSNEGKDYKENLNLLLAASGDLRNVIKTAALLPQEFKKSVSVAINDLDFDIVARNIIILLVALVSKDTAKAVDCILHVWYSAFIRQSDHHFLNNEIRPFIQDVLDKTKDKSPGTLLGKTWKFGNRSLRVTLTKKEWSSLLSYFEVPQGLDREQARSIRDAITLAEERRDYRERNMMTSLPAHRVCKYRFREDGLFLPFGHSREGFDLPNPTLFQTSEWPMQDSADPFNGWDPKEVLRTSSGLATNDFYGKLFYHIQGLLKSFLTRIESGTWDFQIFNVDAKDLPTYLDANTYARIEVSNIVDEAYLGIHRTIGYLCPLLQLPDQNPHATLITLFMNAVQEEIHASGHDTAQSELQEVAKYFKPTRAPTSSMDPEMVTMISAIDSVRDMDKHFDRYMRRSCFGEIESYLGVAMKQRNTIVEKWPLRIKLMHWQKGALDELKTLLSSPHTGDERYVEWKRTV